MQAEEPPKKSIASALSEALEATRKADAAVKTVREYVANSEPAKPVKLAKPAVPSCIFAPRTGGSFKSASVFAAVLQQTVQSIRKQPQK